ncbi:transposable element Tcb1 transposase [Trichonephila clavipes]|nr:transposable element Tcb1 transposase [Trichonephila clavipes]
MTNLGTRMTRRHCFKGICLQHQDGHIRAWWHRDERTLAVCIRHRHTDPSPGVMGGILTNEKPHVAGIVRTYLDTKNVRLLPWPARSPGLSPVRNVWFLVAERLARHHTSVTTVDELWHRVEAAWAPVHVHTIQSLFDSMPKRISAVTIARGGCSGY